MTDYETLGAFYIGRPVDPATHETLSEPLLYDARDLTTHAVILGMTGSGKTGLGVGLLEEAIIDGIPVIAIDPKGDLGNLLLTFPNLAASDFRPWIDESAAAREGRTPDEHAHATAELWRKGLAKWDQGPERIARYAASADRCLYTPGSRAGVPVSVLGSFAPPSGALHEEARRESLQSAVSGLLGLLGLAVDPLRSREHILLSTLLGAAWDAGRAVDLPTLIQQIQTPPVSRIGVLDVDSFFPPGDRFTLAMQLNNLLASPGFEVWTEGAPLDAASLLYGPGGRPRLSIFSISHLSDAERMFFVTRLLGELVSWMRAQPGSQGLRAVLYMDEVFGYLPPTANPPSKLPLLTLLKQARAAGLGVVLSTQNPVDLDYKALSNAGTWFLGRLQTERDKLRVLDGLESATGSGRFDRAAIDRTLSALGPRRFVLNNVHEDGPVLFETRWALSYLAGPMTRSQIERLTASDASFPATGTATRETSADGHTARESAPLSTPSSVPPSVPPSVPLSVPPSVPQTAPPSAARAAAAAEPAARPIVAPGIEQGFVRATRPVGANQTLVYRPYLAAVVNVHYANARARVDRWDRVALWFALDDDIPSDPWTDSHVLGNRLPEHDPGAVSPARFSELPGIAARAKTHALWKKKLASYIHRERPLTLHACKQPKLVSEPGESVEAFLGRLRDELRGARDLEIEKLRRRYAPKLATLQSRIVAAEQRVEVETEQYQDSRVQSALSIGATLVGALFGRKLASRTNVGRASTAMRGVSRSARQKGDIARAEEKVGDLRQRMQEIELEFEKDLAALQAPVDVSELEVDEQRINPRKSDIDVERFLLLWAPWRIGPDGVAETAFEG